MFVAHSDGRTVHAHGIKADGAGVKLQMQCCKMGKTESTKLRKHTTLVLSTIQPDPQRSRRPTEAPDSHAQPDAQ